MIILFTNPKGGVGKTLTSTNFVTIAVSDGVDAELIDGQLSRGGARAWTRIRNEGDIKPYIPLKAGTDQPGQELLGEASKYDLVVVDMGAESFVETMQYASVADLILVPCGPDQLEVEKTTELFQDFRAHDAKHRSGRFPAYVVLNQMPTVKASKEEAATRQYFEDYGIPVFKSRLCHRASWRNARRAGMAVHELTGKERDLKAAAEMRAIYDETVALATGQSLVNNQSAANEVAS